LFKTYFYSLICSLIVSSLNRWINCCSFLYSTNSICSFNSCNLNVSVFTPWRSPWISNNVVFYSRVFISSKTNSINSVAKICSTILRVQNTWFVILENYWAGINWDWNWLFYNSSHKLRCRLNWNSSLSISINNSKVFACLASLLWGSVRVLWSGFLRVRLRICVSFWCHTSITSFRLIITINKLLFR